MNLRPVIAICGTTGVGKSDLAVELASHLSRGFLSYKGAKVINADAMQVYRGMDIITNKIPESERRGIEHLLMSFKEPGEQYVVGQWIDDALKAIDETHRRNEIPILVGGTSYWIQHLLFPGHLLSEGKLLSPPGSRTDNAIQEQSAFMTRSISSLKTENLELFTNLPDLPPSAAEAPKDAWRLYTLLSELDPAMSNRWHWRDTRKVLRSLQIIKESGRKASDVIAEQATNPLHGKPRFPTLFFWLYSEPSDLAERLDCRVDKMMQQGLLDEVRNLRKLHFASESPDLCSNGSGADYTLGIYQAIGFREFNDYIAFKEPCLAAFQAAVERMKISTRQYAKRQISWIRNKLLPAIKAANLQTPNCVPIYLLDATNPGEFWCENVKKPAIKMLEDFLGGRILQDPLTLSSLASKMLNVNRAMDFTTAMQEQKMIICPVCTAQPDRPVMIIEGRDWDTHKRTRTHRRLEAKQQEYRINCNQEPQRVNIDVDD
ncbi:hypothetical protein APHAL10511_001357 [Amanita phalloides]|nr:hypothetical protein APHAL10511_001357 [Amanita phalloides]